MIQIGDPSLLHDLEREFTGRTGLGTSAYRITPRSPWPSELFALFCLGRTVGVLAWLESGTYHGQAADVLARAMPEATVRTVEIDHDIGIVARARLAWAGDRVAVLGGADGAEWLPRLASGGHDLSPSGPIGAFIDGPKGMAAAILARKLLDDYPAVRFVGCHDMARSVMGRAVPARAALQEIGTWDSDRWCWATDDEEWVARTAHLDDGLREAHVTEDARSGWRPYEHFAVGQPTLPMRSYGPTIMVLGRGPR